MLTKKPISPSISRPGAVGDRRADRRRRSWPAVAREEGREGGEEGHEERRPRRAGRACAETPRSSPGRTNGSPRAAEALDRRPRPVGRQLEERRRPGEPLAPVGELARRAPRRRASRAARRRSRRTGRRARGAGRARRPRSAVVERAQLADEDADRPAVGDDVVEGEEERRALRPPSRRRVARRSGPRARSNGRARLRAQRRRSHLGSRAAPRRGPRGRPAAGRAGGPPARSPAPAASAAGAEDRAQRLVAARRSRRGCAARTPARAGPQAAAPRHVVGRAPRLELVEEPEPLLGEGERQRRPPAPARARRRRAASSRPAPARGSISAARPATVGGSKSARSGSSTPKAWRTRDTTWVARSECPPSAKKSSSAPTRSTPRTSAQIPRAAPRPPSAAAPTSRPRRRCRGLAADPASARRSTLPLAVSGRAVEEDEGRGHHVLRQPALEIGARALPAERRRPAARHHDRPPAGGPPGPSSRGRRPPPLAPRDGSASAASISPGSIRKPRIFTWSSIRPEELDPPPGRRSARGRRSGRGALPRPPGSANGLGHEALGGQLRPAEIAAGEAVAATQSSPGTPTGTGASRGRGRRPGVGDRPAERHRAPRRRRPQHRDGRQVKVVFSVGP